MTLSRRGLIVGAGAAVAAAAKPAPPVPPVGVAPETRESIGVVGTILQDGPTLTGFGWLTHVVGLEAADLFTDPAKRAAGTARLRWHSDART